MAITVQRWQERTSWNKYLAGVPGAHFQQGWEWGELAPQFGSKPLRLAATANGAIVGAMQLFISPVHRTGRSLLYVPRGPAVRTPSLEVLGPLLDAARQIGMEEAGIGIRLEPGGPARSREWIEPLEALGLHATWPPSQPRSAWVLNIDAEPDALLSAMKPKTRYNIRLSSRKGVEVVHGTDDDLHTFYRLYQETAQRDDFFIQPESFYAKMFSLYRRADSFALLLARYRDEVIAAVTLVRLGSTCWYVHGASSNEHRNLMAAYLLQWEAIEQAKSWGCTCYDFRAIPDTLREDQDMYGVYRFKEGFGGRQVTTLDTYASAYQSATFGAWQAFFSARFAWNNWRRRRGGLPIRQFA